ncbi:MAG: hypothetical protein RIC24_09720 [Hyphomicrobiales bacterium]|jgi:hypothetical protein
MNFKRKRRELQAFVGTLGIVAGLGGYIGNLCSNLVATFLMIAIILVGIMLVNVVTDAHSQN